MLTDPNQLFEFNETTYDEMIARLDRIGNAVEGHVAEALCGAVLG